MSWAPFIVDVLLKMQMKRERWRCSGTASLHLCGQAAKVGAVPTVSGGSSASGLIQMREIR